MTNIDKDHKMKQSEEKIRTGKEHAMGQQSSGELKYVSMLHRKTHIFLNERTKALGVSGAKVPFIFIACECGKLPQYQFCSMLDISKGTVAKMLAGLEKEGYITRSISAQDGRSMDVFPTQKALDLYPRLVEIGCRCTDKMTEGLTEEEREQFFRLLKKTALTMSRFVEAEQD